MPKVNIRKIIGAIVLCALLLFLLDAYTVSRPKYSEGKLEYVGPNPESKSLVPAK